MSSMMSLLIFCSTLIQAKVLGVFISKRWATCIPEAVNGGGVDEIITDGFNGFTVPEPNPDLIVDRIANLI